MGQSGLIFSLFSLFSSAKFTEKIVGFSGIRTRIVRLKGRECWSLEQPSLTVWPDVGMKSSQIVSKSSQSKFVYKNIFVR